MTNNKIFFGLLASEKIDLPEPEFKFHDKRKWKFDFAWINHKVALEVEGGVWTRGRHTRGSGFMKDLEKYNTAASLGWRIIKTVPSELLSMKTIGLIKQTITNS